MADGDCSVPSTAGEAKALGLNRFFTGRPCKHGHVAERYVAAGKCIICQDIASKKWINADPGRARKSLRARGERFSRTEKYAANTRRYRATGKYATKVARHNASHAHKARMAKWWRQHRPKANAYWMKRHAAKLTATPGWNNPFFIAEAYELAELRTHVTGIRWNVDHIIPLRSPKVCGLHVHTNLQVIPEGENFRKSNRYWPDMA